MREGEENIVGQIDAKSLRIFIVVCNSQEIIRSSMAWSLLDNVVTCPFEIQLFRSGHPISVVRNNQGIKEFLESDADIVVKMDVDQVYPRNYLRDMAILTKQYNVIGPVIYDRFPPYTPIVCSDKNAVLESRIDITGRTGIKSYPYTHSNNFYTREVYESIVPPWYDAIMSPDGFDRINHTDYDMLDRIKAAGYKIYLNHDMVVGHTTNMTIDDTFHNR